jgi:arsenite methyltransferase
VFAEAARVLKASGRFAVTDVVANHDIDEAIRRDMAAWTGCLAGALTREEYVTGLEEAGFIGITVTETHRVHEHAGSAIIRAHKHPSR